MQKAARTIRQEALGTALFCLLMLAMPTGCLWQSASQPITTTTTPIGTLSLTVSPSTNYTYLALVLGQVSAQTFTLTNRGTETLNFTSAVGFAPGSSSEFTILSNSCTVPLTSTSPSCNITVQFTPTSIGSASAIVSIVNNATSSPQAINLSGTGTAVPVPQLTVTPSSSFTFPNITIGQTDTQTFVLSNVGTATLNFTSAPPFPLSGASAFTIIPSSNSCGATLAASAFCTVAVTFKPPTVMAFSASISIANNAVGSPQMISLSGSGMAAPAPQLSIAPSSPFIFPTTTIGQTNTQTFVLSNIGTATLDFTFAPPFVVSGPSSFTIISSSNPCGATLAVNASCIISVTFDPASATTSSASISIANNAVGSLQSINMSGTGVAASTVSAVTVTCTPNPIFAGNATTQPTTTTCTAAVTGTGTYNSAVTWNQPVGGSLNITSPTKAVFASDGPFNTVVTATSVQGNIPSNPFLVTVNIPSGTIYWGADGHRDKEIQAQSGPYYFVSLSQQIGYLKAIFGQSPNTIFYRAWDDITITPSDIPTLQSESVVPLIGVITYPSKAAISDPTSCGHDQNPGWYGFTSDQDANSWAYAAAQTAAQAVKSAQQMANVPLLSPYWVVGNEWNNQGPLACWCDVNTANQCPQRGIAATDWSTNPYFSRYVAALAGAIQALREAYPTATIVSGANGGYTSIGLSDALAAAISQTYSLSWDYTNLHWYNDAANNTIYYADWGLPTSFDGGKNAYVLLNPTQKPLFIDEFGSSDGAHALTSGVSEDPAAAADIINLMTNFLSNSIATSTAQGVVAGTYYELYPSPETGDVDKYLYTYDSTTNTTQTAAQGKAVTTWILNNHNPSIR